MNPLKDVFKDCDRKSTNHKGEHIFSLHKAFLINVAGYKLPFADKIRDPSFGKFSVDLFLLMRKV